MRDDEWLDASVYCLIPLELTEWQIERDSTIYLDSLYCEEIGIVYP